MEEERVVTNYRPTSILKTPTPFFLPPHAEALLIKEYCALHTIFPIYEGS